MYREDDRREGVDFDPEYLPEDDRSWHYGYWLKEQLRTWTYLRRVLRKVRCVNPTTGAIDVLFAELIDEEVNRFPESDECRRACSVDMEFYEDGSRLNRCACDALAMLSPENYRMLVDAHELDSFTLKECLSFASKVEAWQDKPFWNYHFLNISKEITSIISKWEWELTVLQYGVHLAAWRYYASKSGAIQGGRRSGATRARRVRLTPSDASRVFDELVREGRNPRDIAGIIAKRYDLTSDHVRRLLSKNKRHEPPSDPI